MTARCKIAILQYHKNAILPPKQAERGNNMTHKAIFRQHWSEAFRDAAFRARLRDPNMAERWAQARFAEEFLPLRQRLCCVKLIEAAAEATPSSPTPTAAHPPPRRGTPTPPTPTAADRKSVV